MRILLVDDEPALRELLRVTFEGADVVVDEAESADEAKAKVDASRPDLIVLDVRMPGIGGAELCADLKGSPARTPKRHAACRARARRRSCTSRSARSSCLRSSSA
ncbi:MAG: response regulator [Actinobacteria bacterium]|nr:MAG: response regulator [Actinomycetota bacterium]